MKSHDNNLVFELKPYDRETLAKSFYWLNDTDIQLGMNISYQITREAQETWYSKLNDRVDYKIWSFCCNGVPIGAGGFRNITLDSGELTCYIGDKHYWGKGKVLVNLLLEKAKQMKLKNVKLKVLQTNHRALNCYLKQGFIQTSEDNKFKYLRIKIL